MPSQHLQQGHVCLCRLDPKGMPAAVRSGPNMHTTCKLHTTGPFAQLSTTPLNDCGTPHRTADSMHDRKPHPALHCMSVIYATL